MQVNQIIHGDCLEVMKEIPDKSVDLVLTDPPYGVNLKYNSYADTESNWFNLINELIPEIKRVGNMCILPCMQINKLPYIYSNFPPDWLICWYKGSPGHCAFIGFNDWEPLLVYGKTDGLQMHDYFYAQPETKKNGHPCPKSVQWAKWLIDRATKEGNIVLDCFSGSGTTAIACLETGRNYICIEKDKTYYDLSIKRVNDYKAQTKLEFA